MSVYDGSAVSWEADTDFLHNHAFRDGGAISIGSCSDDSTSRVLKGSMTFLNNSCEAGGGGMAITGAVSIDCQKFF